MPLFEIPESVAAYYQEPATRAVVDSLVSTLDDPVLPDMDRDSLINLSEGVLLACQIRADFVAFMAALWENTFRIALENERLDELFPDHCTIKEVWTEKHFWSYVTRGTDLDRPHFDLTVRILQRSNEIVLCVWRYDEDDELRAFGPKSRLPDGWRRINDDGEPRIEATTDVTITNLIEDPERGLGKLQQCASSVVGLIGRLMRSQRR